MELREQRANELKEASVSISTQPIWSVKSSAHVGVGTCISPNLILTTTHVGAIAPRVVIWNPLDQARHIYYASMYWKDDQNVVLKTNKKMPFRYLPLPQGTIDKIVTPGATLVFQDGYAFYDVENPNNMLIGTATYEGHEHLGTKRIIIQAPVGFGTSGAGLYSVEDGILIGVEFGFEGAQEGVLQAGKPTIMIGYETSGYGRRLKLMTSPTVGKGIAEQVATNPPTITSYDRYGTDTVKKVLLSGVAALAAGVLVKELMS